MANYPYYAVLYDYDKDGSVKAEMPCFDQDQVVLCAARYEKVRVMMPGRVPFWLKLTKEERDKHPPPQMTDLALELMRDYGDDWTEGSLEERRHNGPVSDEFYDIWKGVRKDKRW